MTVAEVVMGAISSESVNHGFDRLPVRTCRVPCLTPQSGLSTGDRGSVGQRDATPTRRSSRHQGYGVPAP